MTKPRLPHPVSHPVQRYLIAVLAVLMIAAGGLLVVRAMSNRPSQLRLEEPDSPMLSTAKMVVPSLVQTQTLRSTQSVSPTRTTKASTPTIAPIIAPIIAPATRFTITVALGDGLPLGFLAALTTSLPAQTQMISLAYASPTATVRFGWDVALGTPIYTQTFAAASRFDTIDPVIGWSDLQQLWQGTALTYSSIALISDTLPALQQALGPAGGLIEAHETISDVVDSVWDDRSTLVLIPFDQLVPRLTVLAIDGQNPVENAAYFDPTRYPLTATLFVEQNPSEQNLSDQNPGDQKSGRVGKDAQLIGQWLRRLPNRNRNETQLTVVAATGVTAMARMMGAQMDELGSEWPATEVGPTLAAADLTIFSNEVSFAPDCETSANPDTLVFCSKPAYWKTLELSGIDLLNLTGNHVNDWGRDSFAWSLDFYKQKGIPYYGGGATNQAAVQPIFVEHNGNRLAFLGANSIGPPMAWASDSLPGAARFDFGEAAALIEQIRTEDKATVIFYDIQYTESYGVSPLVDQRNTFNTLLRYGADVVTGVQAHVPQALEFTEGKLILFGLGNLYFDQMWGEATRQGLIAKHTIYEGRHLSTQILVTVLYEYGQPRWATPAQREEILQRVFVASYW